MYRRSLIPQIKTTIVNIYSTKITASCLKIGIFLWEILIHSTNIVSCKSMNKNLFWRTENAKNGGKVNKNNKYFFTEFKY